MKRNVILAVVAIAATSTSAFAADLRVKARPVVAPVYSWTGVYVGASVGYGWDRGYADYSCADEASGNLFGGCTFAAPPFGGIPPVPLSFNGTGGLAGLQAGYNYQVGAGLVGVEADYSWSRVKGDATSNFPFFPQIFGANTVASMVGAQNLQSFGTIRGRLGWLPSQQWLLYVTGGFAFGQVSRDVAFTSQVNALFFGGDGTAFQCVAGQPCFLGAAKQSSVGWTVGGGSEWAISTNVSVKAEYLYANLAGATITARALNGGGVIPSSFRTTFDDINLHVARIGINYRFNAPNAPVVAKY